jgi:signal transduction histidine kinase/ActR/RegA family two-component response regulator
MMPATILVLLVLFAFFIFLCGAGHVLRCLDKTDTQVFHVVNDCTALVSITTAIYLLPLIPSVLGQLDKSLADLVKLNHEAIESRKKLFTFMAFLCHEIRNPLFAITSSATTLDDTHLDDEQAIAVGSIMDSTELMLRLVNDVLDLSKIDAGKLELEDEVFDLHRMIGNLTNTVVSQVQTNHKDKVKFNISIGSDVPQKVSSDPVRLLQILYNLISNSLKFTQEGHIDLKVTVCSKAEAIRVGICASEDLTLSYGYVSQDDSTITATAHTSDDDAGMFSMSLLNAAEEGRVEEPTDQDKVIYLKICVSDTGIGIEQDRLDIIFEPYSQAKLSDHRKHGGTGLGLSIISGLSKAMGGTISATSTVHVGTSFVVHIPVKIVSEAQPPESMEFIELPQLLTSLDDVEGRDHLRRVPLKLPSMCPSSFRVDDPTSSECLEPTLFHDSRSTISTRSHDTSSELSVVKLLDDSPVHTSSREETVAKSATTRRKAPPLEPFSFPPNDHVVLVVDDNSVNQKIIAKMLDHFKVEHRIAGHGQEAVDVFVDESRNLNQSNSELAQFVLVFMDLSMPVMDGYDAITELRKLGVSIPIVALTANALQQERDRAAAVGATDFQTKPIFRKDFHEVCKKFLLK